MSSMPSLPPGNLFGLGIFADGERVELNEKKDEVKPKQECPHSKCTNNRRGRCILVARLYEECNEVLGNCPECGGPATHPSGLCRDCHQGKLEAEDP